MSAHRTPVRQYVVAAIITACFGSTLTYVVEGLVHGWSAAILFPLAALFMAVLSNTERADAWLTYDDIKRAGGPLIHAIWFMALIALGIGITLFAIGAWHNWDLYVGIGGLLILVATVAGTSSTLSIVHP